MPRLVKASITRNTSSGNYSCSMVVKGRGKGKTVFAPLMSTRMCLDTPGAEPEVEASATSIRVLASSDSGSIEVVAELGRGSETLVTTVEEDCFADPNHREFPAPVEVEPAPEESPAPAAPGVVPSTS